MPPFDPSFLLRKALDSKPCQCGSRRRHGTEVYGRDTLELVGLDADDDPRSVVVCNDCGGVVPADDAPLEEALTWAGQLRALHELVEREQAGLLPALERLIEVHAADPAAAPIPPMDRRH